MPVVKTTRFKSEALKVDQPLAENVQSLDSIMHSMAKVVEHENIVTYTNGRLN